MSVIELRGRGPIWLPEKFKEFRPHQEDAINEALDLFESGINLVALDAPTGAGKTVVGEAIRILHNSDRALYVCTTKGLQDQFLHDFPHATVIKGRANYSTYDNPDGFEYGLDAAACTARTLDDPPPAPDCITCSLRPDLAADDTYEDSAYQERSTNLSWRHCDFCHPVSMCPYKLAKPSSRRSVLPTPLTC